MASVFTYDPDPPRVASPWIQAENSTEATEIGKPRALTQGQDRPGLLSEYGVTKLCAEPQEGPTEYKLHLLLRQRRPYKSLSTEGRVKTRLYGPLPTENAAVPGAANQAGSTTNFSSQPRQQRLQHLTTQLLWRLQQSSPYHATSSKELTIPKLPEHRGGPNEPIRLEPLVPGLEESRGALYEIGVSDDGHLVGLAKDEMDESLYNLKLMAASLGCYVEVVRMIIVGDCEWAEQSEPAESTNTEITRQGKLWVVEALVLPNLGYVPCAQKSAISISNPLQNGLPAMGEGDAPPSRGSSATPQLRVTFTGPTTSGKSSLLGTLSTGTLDNGRGKSRLSLLKHRHEMDSGVTSSIAQELIGYRDHEVINFSHPNIESWIDIHDRSEGGRLIFVSDSGGHPRYRRTVLRGLMNWSPHWSVLCIAADDGKNLGDGFGTTAATPEMISQTATDVDFVNAHLSLSLELGVPMAIVVTKLDLASKSSLQKTMVKILDAVKEYGRVPKIIRPGSKQADQLRHIPEEDLAQIKQLIGLVVLDDSLTSIVPIVLTSAVSGSGIGMVHALLEHLPLPPAPTAHDFVGMVLNPEQPRTLFHVDDTFSLPIIFDKSLVANGGSTSDHGVIVTGYLRFGSLSVGDAVLVGPFQSPEDEESRGVAFEDRSSSANYGLSISHPSSAELARIAARNAVAASTTAGEWHRAIIVSTRNLRLPVQRLEAGQAGSIGVVLDPTTGDRAPGAIAREPARIRRGMVLAMPKKHMIDTGLSLQAASGFTAVFQGSRVKGIPIGSLVNVYIANVRAAARVTAVTQFADPKAKNECDEIGGFFGVSEVEDDGRNIGTHVSGGTEVHLELLHNREWIEMGSRVIILEGGRQDRSGLEGLVGKVMEIVD